MAKETKVDSTEAFAQLAAEGAVRTEVVLIQHDLETNIFDCSLVVRGYDAEDKRLPEDKIICPSPCKISQALNPNA